MWFPYFKGQPTDYIYRYSGGRLRGEGQAKAFYYWRYNTQVVAVPTQSQDVSFDFNELSADHQQVTIQGQATFRISEPKRAAQRFNFSIDPLTPASRQPSITAAIAASHGQRSASESGVPADIFATFAGGCSASPSWNRQPSRSASPRATVVLPLPETPITTSITAAIPPPAHRRAR